MPYVHRYVEAGCTVEHRKMHTYRVHTKGVKRKPHTGSTSEAQAKVNERVAEENLRWLLNANFGYKDLHLVLHYFDKERTFEQCRKDLSLFLAKLRRVCRKKDIELKYIAVTETKRMTNIHHHIILKRMDTELLQEIWEQIPGSGGTSFRPLDRRGNHYKLASYLIKESRSTMQRYKDLGIRGKRYSASQNLAKPKVRYEKCAANSWRDEPRPRKGAQLYKFDDGATYRSGYHEESGYPFQEYFEVFLE